jgi:hypothetical protein
MSLRCHQASKEWHRAGPRSPRPADRAIALPAGGAAELRRELWCHQRRRVAAFAAEPLSGAQHRAPRNQLPAGALDSDTPQLDTYFDCQSTAACLSKPRPHELAAAFHAFLPTAFHAGQSRDQWVDDVWGVPAQALHSHAQQSLGPPAAAQRLIASIRSIGARALSRNVSSMTISGAMRSRHCQSFSRVLRRM